MDIAFFCSTPYQLILAIQLKNTNENFSSADMFLLNHFEGADELVQKLERLSLFNQVSLIDSTGFMKEINYEGHFFKRFFKKFFIYLNYKKYIKKYVQIEYCGRFLPALRFFLPLFAEAFTIPCGEVYQLNLSCS